MNHILQYIPGDSLIHRMNPITKIVLTMLICASAFITDHPLYLTGLLAADLLHERYFRERLCAENK